MIIYFIEPIEPVIQKLATTDLVALSINFPRYVSTTQPFVTYAFNPVKIQQLGLESDYDTDDGDIN